MIEYHVSKIIERVFFLLKNTCTGFFLEYIPVFHVQLSTCPFLAKLNQAVRKYT